MALQPATRRVVTTRSGQYAVAVFPLWHSPIPGFHATAIQAVRTDDPTRAVRLTLYERRLPGTEPHDRPHAA